VFVREVLVAVEEAVKSRLDFGSVRMWGSADPNLPDFSRVPDSYLVSDSVAFYRVFGVPTGDPTLFGLVKVVGDSIYVEINAMSGSVALFSDVRYVSLHDCDFVDGVVSVLMDAGVRLVQLQFLFSQGGNRG
jgi:hypothetical protein